MGYFDKFNKAKGIPFMEGREKMNLPLAENLHITDYGFINGSEKPYAVMLFAEYPDKFAFGNTIVTSDLQTIESDAGSKEEALALLAGVAVKFTKSVSKRGREYVSVEFIEDDVPFN